MKYKNHEIKEGITFHTIETNKFKTNLLSVFLTTPLLRENITKEALIASILRRGTMTLKTSEEISKHLEEMYGASFDCGIEKIGNNHIIKFYLETINDEYLPKKEDILKESINTMLEIVFNPLVEDESFKDEYVKMEKENLRQLIEGKKDNKAKYALNRCIEEMYKNKPYGLYKFGYVEDLENISNKNVYEYYKEMLQTSKIDIFASGNIDIVYLKELIEENENIKKLIPRKINSKRAELLPIEEKPKVIKEPMEVTQGKLVLGMNIHDENLDAKYTALIYNAILGGGANSKLFQNVREKASLAYTAGSNYVRQINTIFVRCGIEIENYEKALEIINKQIEDMKNGNFSEEDLENAKTTIISGIKFIPDEQDTGITYYFGQVLSGNCISFEEYEEKIKKVTKEQVINIANKININTIYFLTGKNN